MSESAKGTQKLSLSVDFRWVSLILLAAIAIMLLVWKPWSGGVTDRTVEVTGQATVSARPDEFIFYPSYDFTNKDKDTALDQMTKKSNTLVAQLKKLGVADKDIKTNSDSWSYPIYDGSTRSSTYTLRLTVTVGDDKLAQKVQDYLITTTPTGSVSPQANFSDKKRKELENQARDEASKDARKKAETSAKNLGFRLAAVKTVNDGAGFGSPLVGYAQDIALPEASRSSTMAIQPGENDLTYTVAVTYYIR